MNNKPNMARGIKGFLAATEKFMAATNKISSAATAQSGVLKTIFASTERITAQHNDISLSRKPR